MDTKRETDADEAATERRDEAGDAFRQLRVQAAGPPVALALPLGLVKPADAVMEPPEASKEPLIRTAGENSEPSSRQGAAFNPMLGLLAKGESDIVGLVAYGYYKLSKRDWLAAFRTAHQRMPDEAELEAFIIGERMPRRLANYRQQAEGALERSPDPTELAGEPQPQPQPERPRMATIFHQLTRQSPHDPISAPPVRRMANGKAMPEGQPNLRSFWRYLLILAGLVICLAILVNYAKSTVFLN